MPLTVSEAARSILATIREQFAEQTLVCADASTFTHLDLAAYARFQADMEKVGFKSAGDLEVLEISNSAITTIARTFVRSMLSMDGAIIVGYYQIKPRIGRKVIILLRGLLNLRLVDAPRLFFEGLATRHCTEFETEFGDGRQLSTGTVYTAITAPPWLEKHDFPPDTPNAAILEFHVRRLAEISGGEGAVQPVAIRSTEDILQSQKRQHMKKVAYRASVQYVTLDELRAMSNNSDEVAETVFAEIERQLRVERGED